MNKTTYCIVGFINKNEMADFYNDNMGEDKAKMLFNDMKQSSKYERIVLRKETFNNNLSQVEEVYNKVA